LPANATDTAQGRYYRWGDEQFVSVTTVISDGVPKPGLQRWFIKNIVKAAASERVRLALLTQAEVETYLLSTLTPASTENSAALGSRVHSKAETMTRGESIGVVPDEERPFMENFIRFLGDFKPHYIEAESSVYSRKYGYAGTLDAVVEIDGKTHVLDIKTGKSVWPEVALQLAAYKHADFFGRADGGSPPMVKTSDTGLVLHLRPDRYELVPVDISLPVFDTFLSALDMHRWMRIYHKDVIRPPLTPLIASS
jgi:hypothetical protein